MSAFDKRLISNPYVEAANLCQFVGPRQSDLYPLTRIGSAGIFAAVKTPIGTYAVVRGVPRTFDQAITPTAPGEPIDVSLAREQHFAYCSALEAAGLRLIRILSDDRLPDCVFVEDTAVVAGEKVVIAAMAPESRRGETAAVERRLGDFMNIDRIEPPATLDGGDVLRIGERIFVGLSERTNRHAVEQLRSILGPDGYEVIEVGVRDVLHLKSACTHVGDDLILWRPGYLEEDVFKAYRKIVVPEDEPHAANCVSVNGRVLIPAGAPQTRAMLREHGCTLIEIEISESRKAAGLLTCSSIIL
jgi:dimethylargininase